jgi:hypothetical protein
LGNNFRHFRAGPGQWKEVPLTFKSGASNPYENSFARCLGNFELNRSPSFLLQDHGPRWRAFFAAPLVPTLVPALYAGTPSSDVTSAFYGAFLIYVISLLLGGLFGLPIFYLLGLIRLVNVWACMLGGFLVGAVSGLLITLVAGIGSDAALIYGFQGAGAAAVFWVIWRLGPDPSATFARIWIREIAGSR